MSPRTTIHGVGINDANYSVTKCVYYARWAEVFARCYNVKRLQRRPSYAGCSVDPIWHYFMPFREWMIEQDWWGKHLDKDLLGNGKVYSPKTCLFVSPQVNSFLADSQAARGEHPLGVRLHPGGRFHARISIKDRVIHLGFFDTPLEAHLAWVQAKAARAIELAREQTDPRVAEGLHRYVARLIDNSMEVA